jgi:hypothetical protein
MFLVIRIVLVAQERMERFLNERYRKRTVRQNPSGTEFPKLAAWLSICATIQQIEWAEFGQEKIMSTCLPLSNGSIKPV